jgi:hypothetical protein
MARGPIGRIRYWTGRETVAANLAGAGAAKAAHFLMAASSPISSYGRRPSPPSDGRHQGLLDMWRAGLLEALPSELHDCSLRVGTGE